MRILQVPGFLSAEQVSEANALFETSALEDGAVSAGEWARGQKRNSQLIVAATKKFGSMVVRLLFENNAVAKRCYPKSAVHPTFNCYREGDYYGEHQDNPVQGGIRADISYTIFLSSPCHYSGGELVLGREPSRSFRCNAGDLVLYDAGLTHCVSTVTQGTRRAIVGWMQSVVRDAAQRELLNRFYGGLLEIAPITGVDSSGFRDLNAIRIQLMRIWSDL